MTGELQTWAIEFEDQLCEIVIIADEQREVSTKRGASSTNAVWVVLFH